MAMEERSAVALPQGHGRKLEPRDARRAKRLAVERRILAGLRQCRHDIGERAERATLDVERAAGKALCRKPAARGFEQRNARLQREGERAAAHFDPLDAI